MNRTTARIDSDNVRRGFVAMLPFWISAIPIGIAYSLVARDAGLTPFETQLMSLAVFSSATQLAALTALGQGASLLLIAGLALTLNAQLLLFGLTAGRLLRPRGSRRLLVASLLTDGSFAIASSLTPFTIGTLIGTGASMYAAWNLGTALGLAGGPPVAGIATDGVAIVGPLIYIAVLIPLLRTRSDLLVAGSALLAALAVSRVAPAGVAVIAAALVGVLAGNQFRPDRAAKAAA